MYFTAEKEPHGEYIHLNRLFGHRARIFGVIGAKGYGKTYRAKRYALKRWKYHRMPLTVMRDSETAVDELCAANGQKFFNDVMAARPFLKDDAKIDARQIYYNNDHAGEIMPLSAFHKYKGNSYNIGTVLFDEFIPEKTQVRRGDPAYQFIVSLDTLIRDNPNTRVILTANALDMGAPLLELFDIEIRQGQFGYYYNPDKDVVIYYAADSPEFIRRRENSIAFKLAAGTRYAGGVIANKFDDADPIIFTQREPCVMYGIYYTPDGDAFRLYQSRVSNKYYATKDINPNSYKYMRFVFEFSQVDKDKQYVGKPVKDFLRGLLTDHRVEFESRYILSRYLAVIEKGA